MLYRLLWRSMPAPNSPGLDFLVENLDNIVNHLGTFFLMIVPTTYIPK